MKAETYRLSNDYIDLGQHLININTGDAYEINEEGRKSLDSLKAGGLTKNKATSFMLRKGIIICPEQATHKERFHLQWHLLNDCNLRCTHCYDWKEKLNPLQYEQMLVVIKNLTTFLKKMDFEGEISLTGGEPFLFDKLLDLISFIKKQDVFYTVFILTNGTIPIENTVIDFLRENRVGVQISLDGTKEAHDKIRGAGAYEKSTTSIKKLLEKEINVSVHHVIMKKNMTDIQSYISEMNKLGVRRIHFSNLVPIGPGAQEEMLSPSEYKKVMEMLTEAQEASQANLIGQRPLWTLVGSSGFCPVGYKTLTIDAGGKFLPCRRLPITLGDVKTDTFFKVWFASEFLQKMRQREKYVETCGKCPKAEECGGCRAIANAVLKNPFARDPSCWI